LGIQELCSFGSFENEKKKKKTPIDFKLLGHKEDVTQ